MTDATKIIVKEDLVVKRIIDAPLELVWKAWTEPEHVMKWWGPKHYTSPSCKIDLREGGKYVFCMRAPEDQGGQEHYTAGVYKKIIPMEYLEFTQGLSDKDGNPIDPAQALCVWLLSATKSVLSGRPAGVGKAASERRRQSGTWK